MRWSAHFEQHATFTGYHKSISTKLLVTLYLNTGIVILIVNAKLNNVSVPPDVGVFSGQFTNFDPRWFAGERF